MNKKKCLIISIILTIIAVVFTILVKNVDLAKIGPAGMSSVGFAHFNEIVRDFVGKEENEVLSPISDVLLGSLFLTVPAFIVLGVSELVKNKSLKKVDKSLFILAGFYVLVAAVFLFFEHFVINYRPIYIDGVLEPSYPSSHTLFSVCLALSAMKEASFFVGDKKRMTIIRIVISVVMVATIVTRLFSCVHWATDIIGGILIGAALVSYFYTALAFLYEKTPENLQKLN